jgi:hypothetical protein
MKTLGRVLAILGAVLAITASYLSKNGSTGSVIFLRGLACGFIFSSVAVQIYLYIQTRKEKALEKAGI